MGEKLPMSLDFASKGNTPRVWLKEGSQIRVNPHYSNSMEVLFESRHRVFFRYR